MFIYFAFVYWFFVFLFILLMYICECSRYAMLVVFDSKRKRGRSLVQIVREQVFPQEARWLTSRTTRLLSLIQYAQGMRNHVCAVAP